MSDETILVGKKRSVVPWLLLLVVIGGSLYGYLALHRPLADEARDQSETIGELTRQLREAKAEAEVAKQARAELQKTQDEMKHMREDLARSSAQKATDERLLEQLKKEVGGGAEVQGAGGQITVTMVDRILFKSGEAALTPDGEQVLRKFGGVLAGADKLVEVCGHADNQPVESERKAQFPTNWELSAARATNVVRFLQEQVGIKPRRLKACGFGSSRPIASNATQAGRAKNRRIEILLAPEKVKVVKGDFSDELAAAAAREKEKEGKEKEAKAAHAKAPAKKRAK